MQLTRERILAYLQDHPPSSAGEISRYLEMTPANIRYHLDILEGEGLIMISGRRPAGGAGRPILLYTLTSTSLGDNLPALLGGFLAGLADSESLDADLEKIAQHLAQGKKGEDRNRIQRLNAGVEFLTARQYHASWEARPQGPQVLLRHCPYRDLAQTHPVLCRLDEKLLCLIFGANLALVERRDFGGEPFSPCVFL